MKAGAENFSAIMHNTKFKIPFFQRPYVWKEENWQKMFDELFEDFKLNKQANKSAYFLGSIILKTSRVENYRYVIDGQQRLTTFSLLLKALYDCIKNDILKASITPCLYNTTIDASLEPRIIHSHFDRQDFEKILLQSETLDKKEKQGLVGAYNFFYSQIKENITDEEIYPFAQFITNSDIWIGIKLEDEDEQKIFDSINSSGIKLTATDIVKNALFDTIIKKFEEEGKKGEEEALRLYDEFWLKSFENNNEERKFWEKALPAGGVSRTRSEFFLYAFAVIYDDELIKEEKRNIEHLAENYKNYIKNLSLDELQALLKSLKAYASLYKAFTEQSESESFSFNEGEKRLSLLTYLFKFNTAVPLILFLKERLKEDEKTYLECLKLIEILLLCNTKTKNYGVFFAKCVKSLKSKEKSEFYEVLREEFKAGYEESLNQEQVYTKLTNIDNKQATFILFYIELFRRQNEKFDTQSLPYKFTLEHLIPQKWQENYQNIIQDESKAKKLIYQIGNMTLLKSKLNTSISNAKWTKKREEIAKFSDLTLNKEVLDFECFDEASIEERSKKLEDEFLQIWDIGRFV